MTLTPAPFFTDVYTGPEGGAAYWVNTSDGVRIRVGYWPAENAKGTVLLFPGRTEYIEKYALCAAALAKRGYATLAVDWRGQGLADRLLDDPLIGHVGKFSDYQRDVAALLDTAEKLNVPKPLHLIAHSLGGCVGLRALMNGLNVTSAVFSGPMWGINMGPHLRATAWALGRLMPYLGQGHRLARKSLLRPYVLSEPFANNTLTTNETMFAMMRDHLQAHPELALAGPSFIWLRAALDETRSLACRPSPNVPCLTFLGTRERIVDVDRVHDRMAAWPNGRLDLVDGAEHEPLMEGPEVTEPLFDQIAEHFQTSADQHTSGKSRAIG